MLYAPPPAPIPFVRHHAPLAATQERANVSPATPTGTTTTINPPSDMNAMSKALMVNGNLPAFYFEGGENMTTGDDPIWAEPNTFPILRIDPRYGITPDGKNYFWAARDKNGKPTQRDPVDLAQDVVNHLNYTKKYLTSWPATKPHRYAILIVGIDTGETNIWIYRHPDDVWMMPPPPGSSAETRMITGPWAGHAQEVTGDYFARFFDALKTKLYNAHLPYPDALFTDVESITDPSDPKIFEHWMKDPRADTELFDGKQTLKAWVANHRTALDGTSIPMAQSGMRLGNAYHPNNIDFAERSGAIEQNGWLYAASEILFDPWRAVFSDKPCGEWNVFTGSLSAKVQIRPGGANACYRYLEDGFMGSTTMMILPMYSAPPIYRGDDPQLDKDDRRWETYGNWSRDFPIPANPNPFVCQAELGDAVSIPMYKQLMACRPDMVLIPCISASSAGYSYDRALRQNVVSTTMSQDKLEVASTLGRFCADAWKIGCPAFWIFEPDYYKQPATRPAVLKYVQTANALISGLTKPVTNPIPATQSPPKAASFIRMTQPSPAPVNPGN